MLGAYVLAAETPYLLATKWKEVYSMIKCTKCGREFKSPQALGGHMRSAHQAETPEEVNQPEDLKETENSEEIDEETATETALVPAEASQA